MNLRSTFLKFNLFIALVISISSVYAKDKCKLDSISRARLKFAENNTITKFANKVFASQDLKSELQLFLTFELVAENVLGDKIWSCNWPRGEDFDRFISISSGLKVSPAEMRVIIWKLIKRYPKQLVKNSYYIHYNAIADILENFFSSKFSELSDYLSVLDEFRDDFLFIMKPNYIRWTMGIMPSDYSINRLDNKNALQKANYEIRSLTTDNNTIRYLLTSGAKLPSLTVVDEKSITLINESIDDYAVLYSLGLDPESAVRAITDEMRLSGHGYLKTAAKKIGQKNCDQQLVADK